MGSFLWHSLVGYHLIQFLFFVGIYLPFVNPWICRLSAWLDRETTVTVDDSWKVFNLDCKVCPTCLYLTLCSHPCLLYFPLPHAAKADAVPFSVPPVHDRVGDSI